MAILLLLCNDFMIYTQSGKFLCNKIFELSGFTFMFSTFSQMCPAFYWLMIYFYQNIEQKSK